MKNHSFAKSYLAVTLAIIGLLVGSCTKSEGGSGHERPAAPIFDFTTRTVSTLNVQYDVPKGYQVYFEVYTENPEYLDADGQIVKKDIQPIDVGFTDGNGLYNKRISFAAFTKEIYIYSPYAGVPRVMSAEVNAGGVSDVRLPSASAVNRLAVQQAVTRADDYKEAAYNTISGADLKRLGYWINNSNADYLFGTTKYSLYGRPDYVGDKITVSADILNLINQTLPEGGKVDSNLIKNGDIHVTENANVDLHLIDEQTSANNTLAYYCYETQNPPKTAADIKDIIIAFPNAKVLKYHDYDPRGHNGALERGEGVRLHYWKDGVDLGPDFPANTSIGWIIYNQSYAPANNNGALDGSVRHFYSNSKLNSESMGHVALFRSGDKVIFGFEDWVGDYDYNDVVFYVKSNPIQAITPEIPEVTPETPSDDKVAAEVTYRGILAFEDLWPYDGDFDMNDVVVSYESIVGYNKKNEVLETNDKFTVLHSGGKINNSFAYQLDVRRSEAEIAVVSSLGGDGGAYVDQTLDRATVRLANDVLNYTSAGGTAVFDVATKYTSRRLSKDDFTNPPYNPFITTTSKASEVHLTNMRPTEAMDKKQLGTGRDKSEPNRNLYYIFRDAEGLQLPFAIDIAFNSTEQMKRFVIPKEGERIDYYFPGVTNWVLSGGKQDEDWYLKPRE